MSAELVSIDQEVINTNFLIPVPNGGTPLLGKGFSKRHFTTAKHKRQRQICLHLSLLEVRDVRE